MPLAIPIETSSLRERREARRRWYLSDWFLIPFLSVLGAVPRLTWAFCQIGHQLNLGEAHNAAVGLATRGIISGTYRPPGSLLPPDTAPSAHLLPIPITVAASVYRMFGVDSPVSLVVLTIIATSVALIAFVLFYKAFAAIGMPRSARLGALTVLCCIPINIHLETEDFRYWEGGYAVAVTASLLLTLAWWDTRRTVSNLALFGLACLVALLFFISPQLGLAGYACLALFAWRKLPIRRWLSAGMLATAALALFIVPWAWRNDAVMGRPILLRSNLGLELTIAFFDGALRGNEQQAFEKQYSAVHPNVTDQAFARMQAAGGEESYAEQLGTNTKAWMMAHPMETARLGVRHLVEFVFPPIWSSRLFVPTPPSARDYAWQIGIWFFSATGIVGCAYALWLLDKRYQYAALLFSVSALPYVMVQPIGRYHYIIFAISVFFSALLLDVLARLSQRYARFAESI